MGWGGGQGEITVVIVLRTQFLSEEFDAHFEMYSVIRKLWTKCLPKCIGFVETVFIYKHFRLEMYFLTRVIQS